MGTNTSLLFSPSFLNSSNRFHGSTIRHLSRKMWSEISRWYDTTNCPKLQNWGRNRTQRLGGNGENRKSWEEIGPTGETTRICSGKGGVGSNEKKKDSGLRTHSVDRKGSERNSWTSSWNSHSLGHGKETFSQRVDRIIEIVRDKKWYLT